MIYFHFSGNGAELKGVARDFQIREQFRLPLYPMYYFDLFFLETEDEISQAFKYTEGLLTDGRKTYKAKGIIVTGRSYRNKQLEEINIVCDLLSQSDCTPQILYCLLGKIF